MIKDEFFDYFNLNHFIIEFNIYNKKTPNVTKNSKNQINEFSSKRNAIVFEIKICPIIVCRSSHVNTQIYGLGN